ncbi:MAG TPA: acyl-CoA dehydrogenase [Acidimicrobiales bacterium]
MRLAITEEHLELSRVARSVFEASQALAETRAVLDGKYEGPPTYWKEAATLGWLGLHAPERYGGQGYGLPELLVVVEELGRVVAPGPFVPTVIVVAVLVELGSEEDQARWLPGLCAGRMTAAFGLGGALTYGEGRTAEGTASPVWGEEDADLFLLGVGDDLVVIERTDVESVEPLPFVDASRRTVAVSCRNSRLAQCWVHGARVACRTASVVTAAEAVGAMGACVDLAVNYARVREQFGQPIGVFQAVKHHCADMLVDTEMAAAVTWDAARVTCDSGVASLMAAAAAGYALPAFLRVATTTIQVHGGIGYTWEHDAHLYLRRAASLLAFTDVSATAPGAVFELMESGVRRHSALNLPSEADEYRREARAFVESVISASPEGYQATFAHSGYLVPHWPPPFGRAASAVEQLVAEEELASLPRPSLGIGEWVLLTVLQHATPEQEERWIWPSLEGSLRWCQLFSEPGAGSDAAGIATKARRTDGGWLVNGQKVWSSLAHESELGLATVRTDPDSAKHAGITTMVVDMRAPGVTVRPLMEMTGEKLFNEVFLEDVFVPDENVVGHVNDGWRVARATLGNERVNISGNPVTLQADALIDLATRHRPGGASATTVGTLLIEEQALRALVLKSAARLVASGQAGPEGSLGKLVGAEHSKRVAKTGLELAGDAILRGEEPELLHDFLFSQCLTIAGGTSEILRTQIAERILGLPREKLRE